MNIDRTMFESSDNVWKDIWLRDAWLYVDLHAVTA